MGWRIEFDPKAFKELEKLGEEPARRIVDFLKKRVSVSENPRVLGEMLSGPLKQFWKYRVGDYRIICEIRDQVVVILVVRIGHRRDIYSR